MCYCPHHPSKSEDPIRLDKVAVGLDDIKFVFVYLCAAKPEADSFKAFQNTLSECQNSAIFDHFLVATFEDNKDIYKFITNYNEY